MKYSILFAIGLSLLLPLQADAKQGKHKQKGTATPEEIFKKRDKDGDGMITKDEFLAKKKNPTKAEKRFAKIDTNADGKVSLEEFKAKKNKAEKAGKKGGKKHGKKNK
ncbi:MAG: EF-hand domain-containing protein [Verrucomicrobiota bacterium]